MIPCLFPWGEGVAGPVCCDRVRGAGEEDSAGGVRGDRGDLSARGRAGERGLFAIKDRHLDPCCLGANNFRALVITTEAQHVHLVRLDSSSTFGRDFQISDK